MWYELLFARVKRETIFHNFGEDDWQKKKKKRKRKAPIEMEWYIGCLVSRVTSNEVRMIYGSK